MTQALLHDDLRPETMTERLPLRVTRRPPPDAFTGDEERVLGALAHYLTDEELTQARGRLVAGLCYGPLDLTSPRWCWSNVVRNTREELWDALLYLAFGLMARGRDPGGMLFRTALWMLRRCR